MAKAKEERNRQFIEDWKRGSNDKELGEKYHLSIGGVKGLKARLRKKYPSLYIREKPKPLTEVEKEVARASGGLVRFARKTKEPVKLTSTQTSASTSTKRMTFWLEEKMIERIKDLAAKEGRTASDILREILRKSLESA